jgi:hypothetical protein
MGLFLFLREDISVTRKPTYQELEKRVKELEKEAVMRKQAEEMLREREERLCFDTMACH